MTIKLKKIRTNFAVMCLLLAGLFVCMNCGDREKIDNSKVLVHQLQLKKVMQLDSRDAGDGEPVLFHLFAHDEKDNVYLLDGKAVKLYKYIFNEARFKPGGFTGKGNGPGEFPYVGDLIVLNNQAWIWGARKLARFDESGELLEERKFKRNYWPIEIVDNNRLIVTYTEYGAETPGKKKQIQRKCALMDARTEEIITPLLAVPDIGMIRIEKPELKFSFSNPAFTPDILARYHPASGLIYLAISNEYKIYVNKPDGSTIRVIHRPVEKIPFPGEAKTGTAGRFKMLSPAQKKILIEHLPDQYCVIRDIQFLAGGLLAVSRITGLEIYAIDIFDKDGRFLSTAQMPQEFRTKKIKFYRDQLAFITHGPDYDLYERFEITNLSEIVKQK